MSGTNTTLKLAVLLAVIATSAAASASEVELLWVANDGFTELGSTLDPSTYTGSTAFLDIRITAEPATGGVAYAGVSVAYDTSRFDALTAETCPYAPGNLTPGYCAFPPFAVDDVLYPGGVPFISDSVGTVTGIAAGSPMLGAGNTVPVTFTLARIEFLLVNLAQGTQVDGFYDYSGGLIPFGGGPDPQLPPVAPAFVGEAPLGLTFQVDSTADAVDASRSDDVCATTGGECTLRAAIMQANQHPGRDVIVVPAGTYLLTIPGDGEDAARTGDLDITGSLVLQGAGADCATGTVITETTSSTEGALDVFDGAVEVSGICITGSHRGMNVVGGRLELHDFALVGNTYGFRTTSNGNAKLHSGSIAGNSGGSLGGGVFNEGILTLDRVRIENNASTTIAGIDSGHGGVANASGTLLITNSSISGNTASSASAIHNLATLLVSNVSIFDNTALDSPVFWGTLYNSGAATASLTNVTIDGNGFGAVSIIGGTGISARNTIVADTPGCSGPMTSLGYNRESGTSCGLTGTGDQQNVAIAFTQDTSGPTPTLVPTSGASVQDQGADGLCPIIDQRMHRRPDVGGCDIGAAELASAVACGNGLDDDGDGFCDTLGGTCTDGSTPGDSGCSSPSDPQELVLMPGDVLTGDSDGAVKRLDPMTGDVRILARGLGLRGTYAVAEGKQGVFATDFGLVFEIDRETGMPSLVTGGGQLVGPRGISIDGAGRLLVADPSVDRIVRVYPRTGDQVLVAQGPPLNGPEYVREDPTDGTLLVADYISSTPQGVHRIDPVDGSVYESCTSSLLGDPRQLVLNGDATTLWVVDSGPNRVFEIDLTAPLGSCSPIQIGGGMGDAWGIGLDPSGDLIVASRAEGLFQYVDPVTGVQSLINETPDIALPHQIAVVPEPSQALGLACGIALLLGLARRRGTSRSPAVVQQVSTHLEGRESDE